MNSKYYPAIKFLRQVSLFKRRFTASAKLLSSKFLESESYYPEYDRKSKFIIITDLIKHAIRYGNIEYHYFSYGLDVKGFRKSEEFMDDSEFIWKSYIHNAVLAEIDKTCILRDKELFASIIDKLGFMTPHNIMLIDKQKDIDAFVNNIGNNNDALILKPVGGQCGGGILTIKHSNDNEWYVNDENKSSEEVCQLLTHATQNNRYLVQSLVRQHPTLSNIYDQAVNTIRLITVYNVESDTIDPLSAVLRVGANGNKVDNWAKGGLAIGIDMQTGILSEYGFYKHGKGTKTASHPDTHTSFSGIQIPFWKEAIEQAISIHRHLLPIFIIGWDIAITQDGPLFIEGNDNMEISINQEVHGGLKKIVDAYFSKDLCRKLNKHQ